MAEDLGDLRAEVLELRDHYAFRGMRVIQFSFNEEEMYSDKEHLLVYTGTHDNDTTFAWYRSMKHGEQRWTRRMLKKLGYHSGSFMDDVIQYSLERSADMVIIPMYDWLHLPHSGRINTPGTVGASNWMWRMKRYDEFSKKIGKIRGALEKAGRAPRRKILER